MNRRVKIQAKKGILLISMLLALLICAAGLTGCAILAEASPEEGEVQELEGQEGAEASEDQKADDQASEEDVDDINFRDGNGDGYFYLFTYKGEDFTAIYYYDNWCVYDSYKITSKRAMKKICQALIDEHPVHGSDYESFRTVSDMVYEWKQHNLAYKILPDDHPLKTSAGNVDFDPEDQGKSMREMYEDRTGEEFDIMEHSDDILRYLKDLFR